MRRELFDGSGEVEFTLDSFVSMHKGTCALCFDTVRIGHKLVPMMVAACGDKFRRTVHAECATNLILSSPLDMAQEFIKDLVPAVV